jgi:hypothetical protein
MKIKATPFYYMLYHLTAGTSNITKGSIFSIRLLQKLKHNITSCAIRFKFDAIVFWAVHNKYNKLKSYKKNGGKFKMANNLTYSPRQIRQKLRFLNLIFSDFSFFCTFAGIKKQKYLHTTFI